MKEKRNKNETLCLKSYKIPANMNLFIESKQINGCVEGG
jgi:hypothetical protein